MSSIIKWLKEELALFGYKKSRLEVFINGLIFLFLKSLHDALEIGLSLPNNWWSNTGEYDINKPDFVSYLLLLISYLFINYAIFYDTKKGRTKNSFKSLKVLFLKIGVISLMITISLLITVAIIVILF